MGAKAKESNMVTDQEIEREFEFSVTIDDLSILDKLKEICILCHLSATELVEEWIAPITSAGCNQEPNLSSLAEFERKQSLSKEKKHKQQLSIKLEETKPLMFSKDTIDEVISEEYEDLLECYQTPGNKLSTKRPHITPEAAINKRHASLGRSPGRAPFSLASATPSIKYSLRNNSGEVSILVEVIHNVSFNSINQHHI